MATLSIDVQPSPQPPTQVEVPKPASKPLQVLAALVLLGLSAIVALLLLNAINDDQATAAALLGILLFLPVFVLVVWAAAALGTGVGPRQLIELLKALIDALKALNGSDADPEVDEPAPGQPGQPPAENPPGQPASPGQPD